MKRSFALVALLAALGILCKLAFKDGRAPQDVRSSANEVSLSRAAETITADPEAEILARYTRPADRELADRTLKRYRQTAIAIEKSDGLRGLTLLDRLDLEAVFLYEKYPSEFRRLRDSLNDEAAADLLLHWREYFGLKRADETDRAILVAEVSRLSSHQQRIAAKYPNALPLILADPVGVTEMIERWSGDAKELTDALVVLDFVSLESGAADLRAALRILDDHGPLALNAFRLQGLDGFALVGLYGPVLNALGNSLPLEQALILLRVNSVYVDELLRSHSAETVASHFRHVAAAGLVEAIGGSPEGLRLAVEHGERGERALMQAGSDAADVVYGDFADNALRNQAVEALAEHGTMALAMLDKYASDADFREILRTHGAAIIPPIAATDAGPETLTHLRSKSKKSFTESLALSVLFLSGDNGQATIRTIKKDGLERVAQLNASDVNFTQFLPLYDLLHLGHVLGNGYTPTSGEMAWALIDGCFVVADALSLAAAQPEGVVASEAARAEVRAATQVAIKEVAGEGAESASKVLLKGSVSQGAEASTERLARWWTVRLGGGTYRILRRLPEALPRLGVSEVADLGRTLCAKAGFKLSTWTPVRLLKEGQEVLLRIPPRSGLKYMGAQAAQAGVGVVAFRKMEEHLASRRPQTQAAR
ncbi:hypothetical protein [Singulisphaera sp. PoT]|uniref:hypothetical protein n=1 Tax=Singulisphaera sp. PoT TaxID=3411797 RepID=UPI003BF49E0B